MTVENGEYSFAHLSDPHLPLRRGDVGPLALMSKRITGYLSWTRRRVRIHRPAVLAALVADMRAQTPDHVVVTGDLTNLSTRGEMARARDWLAGLGDPPDVTVVPGNHDFYVRGAGPDALDPYMRGDGGEGFPFVRRRGPVAFIGVTTALPTPWFHAYGAVQAAQLAALDRTLAELGDAGACRVVLLHHPVVGRRAEKARSGLADHAALAQILAARGAELVLHGHIHRFAQGAVAVPGGTAPTLSVASASAAPAEEAEAANWSLIGVSGAPGAWRISARLRGLQPDGGFAPLRDLDFGA